MINLLIRYVNLMVITVLILVIFSFSLTYLFPGDVLTNLTGVQTDNQEQMEWLYTTYKLDQNIVIQFIHYTGNLLSGDWGISFVSQTSLVEEVKIAFPATIELIVYALVIAIFVGIPVGFISGMRHHKPFDFSIVTLSLISYSFPVFWLALILITLFSLQSGLLPLSGRINLLFDVPHTTGFILIDILYSDIPNKEEALMDALKHLILPTVSVALITTAIFIRFTRRSIMDVMEKGYIDAAKSRGFTSSQIFFKHGIRNALLPILPMMALQISTLITNAMVVETIFSWPGIGNWLMQAIYQQDYSAIRVGMLVVSIFVVTLTISIEFFSRAIDPARDKNERGTI